MTDEQLTDLLQQLGGVCGRKIVNDPGFEKRMRQWIKEIVLVVLIEQREIEEISEVRSFLAVCQARGVRLTIRDGKIYAVPRGRLGPELAAVLVRRRESIAAFLEQLRLAEERQRERERPAIAGKVMP